MSHTSPITILIHVQHGRAPQSKRAQYWLRTRHVLKTSRWVLVAASVRVWTTPTSRPHVLSGPGISPRALRSPLSGSNCTRVLGGLSGVLRSHAIELCVGVGDGGIGLAEPSVEHVQPRVLEDG